MRIKKIKVNNFKAVKNQEVDFNGCSAIVIAGNNKGKTSLLKGLIDRFHGEKPDIIVREGEEKGFSIMELSDGSVIEWKFTEKSESFSYTTKEGIKQTTGVISLLGEKYFGLKFDIDKFLNTTPKAQSKILEGLVGLDFTDIDIRHKSAFEKRTDANRELKIVSSSAMKKPELIEKPNIPELKKELELARQENQKLKDVWFSDNEKNLKHIEDFNDEQLAIKRRSQSVLDHYEDIKELLNESLFNGCFDNKKAMDLCNNLEQSKDRLSITNLPQPDYIDTTLIESRIEKANNLQRKYDSYKRDLTEYNNWVKKDKLARKTATECDVDVKEIEKERTRIIGAAQIPKEFEFTEDGILYNGLPLTNNQISSSGKYIAALKLGAMVLGDIRTMHFDASFLDKNSLNEIQEWAKLNNLQLLIERPDFDAGNIKYELIQNGENEKK